MASANTAVVNQTELPGEKKEFKFNPYSKNFDASSFENRGAYVATPYDQALNFNLAMYYNPLNGYYSPTTDANSVLSGSEISLPWGYENGSYHDVSSHFTDNDSIVYFDSPSEKKFKFSPEAKEFIASINRGTMLALRPKPEVEKPKVKLCFVGERFNKTDKSDGKQYAKRKASGDSNERAVNGRPPRSGNTNQKGQNWWY